MQYWHWLAIVSALFLLWEQILPRQRRPLFRPGWLRDLIFLAFNGIFFGALTHSVLTRLAEATTAGLAAIGLAPPAVGVIGAWPLWLQTITFLVVADFIQWCTHIALHRVPWLWQFHKVHHSIPELDWIANFHFHWFEILVYKTTQFLPLMVLGADPQATMPAFVFGTAWGHFNHANVGLRLGPIGYFFNSPAMHLWHHDASKEGGAAKNFGIIFSLWDHLFRTAFWPKERAPRRLGYAGDTEMPQDLTGQFLWPATSRRSGSRTILP